MNHAITVGGLLSAIAVLIGLGMTGLGALALFAGGMSDNSGAGDDATRVGCIIGGMGAALLIVGIWGLF